MNEIDFLKYNAKIATKAGKFRIDTKRLFGLHSKFIERAK